MGSDIKASKHIDPGTQIDRRLEQIEQKLDAVAAGSAAAHVSETGYGSVVSRNDEIALHELWNILWRDKWVVMSSTVCPTPSIR